MDETNRLLRQMLALQASSIRLQKLAIALQAEAVAYQAWALTGGKPSAALEKRVFAAVKQIRAAADRVERGRALPR